MIILRKYYIFVIKEDYKNIYNEKSLYEILKNLYTLKVNNFSYGLSLYDDLCIPFSTSVIKHYLLNKFKNIIKEKNNNFYLDGCIEQDLIVLKKSCLIVVSNLNVPVILKIFNYYSNNLFVCDFDNQDYFWLKQMKNKKYSYE